MIEKYALPCSCGESLAVESRHAGGNLPCPKCGNQVDVPRLRELRQLAPVAASSAASGKPGWSRIQGQLFAAGLVMAAISFCSGLYTLDYRQGYQKMTQREDKPPVFEHDIQQITLIDSWEAWNKFKEIQITSRPQPIHVFARGRVATMDKWLTFFGIFGGVGAILMVTSFFARPYGA